MKITWYLYPLDVDTNQVISGMASVAAEDFVGQIKCSDGVRRNLVQCRSYQTVADCVRSKKSMHLRFDIFVKKGNGEVRPFILPKVKDMARNTSPIRR